jgi:drug/metabolite transporter (DMT)-like permease
VTVALIAAFLAAVCYGVGSVLQAIGARGPATSVFAVARSLPYVAGIALDLMAFAVSTVALRRLPLFSVQAIVASSVVVTALLASFVLRQRLHRTEAVAIAAVCTGLVLLALSSSSTSAQHTVSWLPTAALLTTILVGGCGGLTLRRSRSGPVLGLLAGAAFGLVGLSVRLLTAAPHWSAWLADPAVYALLLSGVLALYLYAAALQRAHVTTTTGIVVTVDALLPAIVGLLLLGDHPSSGRGWTAAVGFLAAVCGAVALSRAGAREMNTDGRTPVAGPSPRRTRQPA